MNVKTKKLSQGNVVKLETSGEIKEIVLGEDFLKSNQGRVEICFRGENSSGIAEMSASEIESLVKEVGPKVGVLKGFKVLKFKK